MIRKMLLTTYLKKKFKKTKKPEEEGLAFKNNLNLSILLIYVLCQVAWNIFYYPYIGR